MAIKKNQLDEIRNADSFHIEGQIQREQPECQTGDLKLAAYVFDKAGTLLGSAELDKKGHYSVAFRMAAPTDTELLVGPADMAKEIRNSSAYKKKIPANNWKGEGGKYHYRFDAIMPVDIWRPWWPLRICISGHVQKVHHHDGITDICPVPYVKVEIFDVDREFCFWPFIRKWWEFLLDKPVIRIPDLLKEPPFPPRPFPGPDPLPYLNPEIIQGLRSDVGISHFEQVALNPQPFPPRTSGVFDSEISKVAFNPQPEPPIFKTTSQANTRVGEAQLIDNSMASRFERLTLTSKIAPWLIFPRCFYSKVEICETTTDCSGFFNCCFNWWPFHFRRGRLRFDSRPDIIIKVTQVIDGVATVIYLDPYTSTRWNVTNAHIDLFLDNEEIRCGGTCTPLPVGKPAFFTLVGLDEVYKIDQGTGKFSNIASGGSYQNWAYGHSLLICGLFGQALSSGAPVRYYRLSHKKGLANSDPNDNTGFVPVISSLYDTRVDKLTYNSQTVLIGPQPPVNGVTNLYEIRNTQDYYWYNPDKICWWDTLEVEPEAGVYTLRLEVFNELGVKLTSADVDYRNGTDPPPGPLPAMVNRCDLVIQIDNRPPDLSINVPGASPICGVVPFSAIPGLKINISVNQAYNRLNEWGLYYVKGITGGSGTLDSATDNAGITPLPINKLVSADPMTAGLTSTCAFSLTLYAWPLIRNGFGRIYDRNKTIAIAIEKCPPCPPCP